MVEVNKREIIKFKTFCKNGFPEERCGFLIGSGVNKDTFVDYIFIPEDQDFQASEDFIDISEDWLDDAQEFADNLNLKIVGFIHSHPNYEDTALSELDFDLGEFLRDHYGSDNFIMGILAISKSKKNDKLKIRVQFWPSFNKQEINYI